MHMFRFSRFINVLTCVFFFSSRRRHTRLSGDWSSDVCSSDLGGCGDRRGCGVLIRVNDLDTHVTVWGEGRPVILLHGWGTSGESMSGIAKALEDRFRVYAIDLPGFGWTAPPPGVWGTRDYAS